MTWRETLTIEITISHLTAPFSTLVKNIIRLSNINLTNDIANISSIYIIFVENFVLILNRHETLSGIAFSIISKQELQAGANNKTWRHATTRVKRAWSFAVPFSHLVVNQQS